MKSILRTILCTVFFTSSIGSAVPINHENDLNKLFLSGITFETVLTRLPDRGESAKKVWTSTEFWPLDRGGTARRSGGGSPLEKLERVSELARGAVAWELDFSKQNKGISWAGHCNGLAAAGIIEEEPKRSVRYQGVDFSTNDVKALLIELHQGPEVIVGARCDVRRQRDQSSNLECDDVNPGTFHLALANFLGVHRRSFVIDISPLVEVWSYAIVSYRSNIRAEGNGRVRVSTRVVTTDRTHNYEYVLEIDAAGRITGGEWAGRSRTDHPDFLWIPQAYSLENPFIDIEAVKEIARRSY